MTIQGEEFNADNLTGQNQAGSNANWPVRLLTATTIIGDRVENNQGENLGKIKDIMLDVRRGSIEYVVLEYGGFLGIGEKLFAIPFHSLELDTASEMFILKMDKTTLEKAPGFDKDHWPETNSHEYYQEVGTYWGNFMGNNTAAPL
ncbi:MAG: PRC-barrel domain-containing protein [Bacteroidota bacterium]